MVSPCACGCGLNVRLPGDYRRDCRLRECDAGRSCPRNVRSAAQTRRKSEQNLTSNSSHNIINNPKNNLIRKRALRTANLQIVQDDPTILDTKKMSAGMSASVSVPTDNDWCTWQPWCITDHQKLVLFTEDIPGHVAHLHLHSRQGRLVHQGEA